MKAKITLLFVVIALLTLSFTFTFKEQKETVAKKSVAGQEEPLGTLASEDKL